MENLEKLTKMQKDHMENDMHVPEREGIHKSWFDDGTVDFWRHRRMYETMSPLAEYYKTASWVSIGDGRYGLDSFRLNKLFGVKVFPTDISENMLREGKKMGLFDEYGVENAESLTFENNSFDVLFCKEAFHHCPRPIIALYEMIRVAKHAVVLIEPNDNQKITFRSLISALQIFAYRMINKKFKPCFNHIFQQTHVFEPSGNYIYSLSNREVNKIAHAMDLGEVAYYEFNDSYVKGVEFEKAEEHNPTLKELKRKIKVLDNKGNHGLTTTVIFKNEVDPMLKKLMVDSGYKFFAKKANPII